MWDGNFREFTHTITFFANQDFPKDDYELIWVDYYDSNSEVKKMISQYSNFRLLTLNNLPSSLWHLGVCINEGVSNSHGDILVIPDGDIAVEEDFLSYVWKEHQRNNNLALYFQRFDEPKHTSCTKSRKNVEYLKQNCELKNANNYGGCLTLRKKTFELIKGYETHSVFAGPGMSHKETYTRLKNAGIDIRWAKEKKVYHPWHPNTLGSGFTEDLKKTIADLKWSRGIYPWINPARVNQSWIIHSRDVNLDYKADLFMCDKFLESMPNINAGLFKLMNEFFMSKKGDVK